MDAVVEWGMVTTLERLPDEDFSRVLCVAAHPDDNEYGISAAVAAWTGRGIDVAYLLLTHGEAGMDRDPREIGPLRTAEQEAACAAVGVTRLTMLDFPDGMLVHGLEVRRAIAREIRDYRPDAIVTGSWHVEVPWGLNHADHRVAGLATVDAARDAANPWVFPELVRDEGRTPWHAPWLLVAGETRSTHWVDVSGEPVRRGMASLAAHRAYLEHVAGHPSPREVLERVTTAPGAEVGVENAMLFRAHRL